MSPKHLDMLKRLVFHLMTQNFGKDQCLAFLLHLPQCLPCLILIIIVILFSGKVTVQSLHPYFVFYLIVWLLSSLLSFSLILSLFFWGKGERETKKQESRGETMRQKEQVRDKWERERERERERRVFDYKHCWLTFRYYGSENVSFSSQTFIL